MAKSQNRKSLVKCEKILLQMSSVAKRENGLAALERNIVKIALVFWNEIAAQIVSYDMVDRELFNECVEHPTVIPLRLAELNEQLKVETRLCC